MSLLERPRTESGRALLTSTKYHWQLCRVSVGDGVCTYADPYCGLPGFIAAIEDEAAAAADLDAQTADLLAALAERNIYSRGDLSRALFDHHGYTHSPDCFCRARALG